MTSDRNRVSKRFKVCFKVVFVLVVIGATNWVCNTQTAGFRLYEIVSAMPNRERWETLSMPAAMKEQLLAQPFFYLGNGEQFYAFLGSDQKTVLKFFRHDHLSPKQLIRYLPLPTQLKDSILSRKSRFDLTPLLDSAKLAYDELREETALLYLHLNKTQGAFHRITIYDKLGIRHEVDLDATEFVLQEHVEPFCEAIDKKMQRNEVAAAKEQIRSLMRLINKQCQKGITNTDASFKRNFGASNKKAIALDLGSYLKDERVKEPSGQRAEVERLTSRLHRWLKKHHPDLLSDLSSDRECLPKTTENL